MVLTSYHWTSAVVVPDAIGMHPDRSLRAIMVGMKLEPPQRIGVYVYLADDAQLRESNHTTLGVRCVIK
jgi:hypothetical protein